MAQMTQTTKRLPAVTRKATAGCGHEVTLFAATHEGLFTLEYTVKFDRCPRCQRTATYNKTWMNRS